MAAMMSSENQQLMNHKMHCLVPTIHPSNSTKLRLSSLLSKAKSESSHPIKLGLDVIVINVSNYSKNFHVV